MRERITGLLVLSAVLLSACGGEGGVDAVHEVERVPVEIITVEARPFTETYRVTAPATAVREYRLSTEVMGTVSELLADVGDYVEKGAVLARLDPEPLTLARDTKKAQFKRAQVRHSLAQKAYARQKRLHSQGNVADRVLDEAELEAKLAAADLELAKLALQNAERDLTHATVTAPEAGEITRRFPELGSVVSPGSPLFHLAVTGRIRLGTGLSERQVVHVQPDTEAEVRIDALDGAVFAGKVVSVGSVDEPGKAAFPVDVYVDNPDRRIRPGMVARVFLPGRRLENALAVPAVALRKGGDGTGVFVIEEGRAVRKPVEVAALVDETAVLAGGISSGARVVVVGQTVLRGGEPVAITVLNGKQVSVTKGPAVDSLP